MKLLVLNGSPRANKANSLVITKWMFEQTGLEYDTVNATDIYKGKEEISALIDYDTYFIIFPLYVDSVPAVTKYVFEKIEKDKTNYKNKNVYFCVHSGFPEAVHSRGCEKYLQYLAFLLDMNYKGTIIIGGSEAIQIAPKKYFKKRIGLLHKFGEDILESKSFDKQALVKINKFEKLPWIFTRLGKLNPPFYCYSQLKKNNVFDKRFDRPYE